MLRRAGAQYGYSRFWDNGKRDLISEFVDWLKTVKLNNFCKLKILYGVQYRIYSGTYATDWMLRETFTAGLHDYEL